MIDTDRQTPDAKVLWHFLMSLDGYVAGPNHEMDWMTGFTVRPVCTLSTSRPPVRC
jgi:riboflavin biosynthesis pyrimidine reductase